MKEGERELIDEFEKNSAETVRTSIQKYRDKLYADFRVWNSGTAETLGEVRPTKKGLTISVEILPDLLKSVQKALSYVRTGQKSADPGPMADFPEETTKNED